MSSLAGWQFNQIMLLCGVGLLVFVMINRARRGFGRSATGSYAARSRRSDLRHENRESRAREPMGGARLHAARASADHESWEVEMHRLARDIKGEIDSKMQALAQLIQQADQACSQLDASLARVQAGDCRTADGLRAPHFGPRARNYKSVTSVSAVPNSESGSREELTDDPRFERVYALADAGFSATRIANQIGSQVGEVELILSLRAT
jgi:hypothetical protein